MTRVPLRVFGLLLLALAISIPSCQALFPRDAESTREFAPSFIRE